MQESRDNSIHKWLIIAGRQISQQLDQRLASIGLNASNYFYILKIHDNPGLTQKILGEKEFIDPSNVTRAVKQLIGQGLIERRSHPQDKRAYQLVLTTKGAAVYPQIFQILDAVEQTLTTAVTAQGADQQHFINALQQISHTNNDSNN
ncbi:MarR family winged helix-turn-helix transcriptional regulator [Loigolactobacillus jiayinensis]|uniref:MarR family winged helix-turn-helix transcriptional regulator n=1 Tax=Loigolactobacillus jiayinensis TaxID=2486016 RepID=A0ABW1RKK8_9LACO|nr:MarR family transcriptional regulator [Loigolactobacillus jiayinensis]